MHAYSFINFSYKYNKDYKIERMSEVIDVQKIQIQKKNYFCDVGL